MSPLKRHAVYAQIILGKLASQLFPQTLQHQPSLAGFEKTPLNNLQPTKLGRFLRKHHWTIYNQSSLAGFEKTPLNNLYHWFCQTYFGKISEPCVIIEPIVSQQEFLICQIFSNSSGDLSQGCGFSQSFGASLKQ